MCFSLSSLSPHTHYSDGFPFPPSWLACDAVSGIAFFYDPDGYSIEIVEREKEYEDMPEFGIAQTMIRCKRLEQTIEFFKKHFGMSLVRKAIRPGDFTNAFMASVPTSLLSEMPSNVEGNEAKPFVQKLYSQNVPVLELTHNEGVDQKDFEYYTGNEEGRKGYASYHE